ncbi:MAG: DUF1957 domain-containing protein, partial [Deltaproteobacteria bacterium]|nr:DUF1957 domain-containing protein [Deltaproteobacteria bacterium]
DSFLEERWLFEAITETYIPLIKFFDRLLQENVFFRISISLSPSLLAMLEDELLQSRYEAHLVKMIKLCEREMERTRPEPHLNFLANMYHRLFNEAHDIFTNRCHRRIALAFKQLHQRGCVELLTTTATHALLPLFASQPKSLSAQITTGLDYFESIFDFRPQGIWLPECGYFPGLDTRLQREGIRYFIIESHGIEHADTKPYYSVYAPLYTPDGIAAFGRDRASLKQVWSAREGFPGDPAYREFYRDIGHDLDYGYISPYCTDGVRSDTGIKYYRITGKSGWKEPYCPDAARERAAQHAGTFVRQRIDHINHLASSMETPPVIIAPFDAELFGHWWFEGPQWLNFVMRKSAFDQDCFALTTPDEYLRRHPVHQSGYPSTSTWGHKGYNEAWLNHKTDWIYPELHECAQRLGQLAEKHGRSRRIAKTTRRALNQCLRELLLAQSSDWPFIINSDTSSQYAERRIKDHVARFHCLADGIQQRSINTEHLAALEQMDAIFPDADFLNFCDPAPAAISKT